MADAAAPVLEGGDVGKSIDNSHMWLLDHLRLTLM